MIQAVVFSPSRPAPKLGSGFSSLLVSKHRVFSNGAIYFSKRAWRHSMFLNAKTVLKDGNLNIDGKDALTEVPENIVITPVTNSSAFIGAVSSSTNSRHVFKLGVIQDVRFVCLFRFKIFWMIPRFGNSGKDIPVETQMLLMEARERSESDELDKSTTSYVLFLPVLDGEFRTSLQGNSSNEIELCVESGDPAVVTSQSLKAIFVNYGKHPFDLVKDSMKILEKQTGTFALRKTKQVPKMLDWFGWCTWDAFYTEVNPQGIKDGLKSLSDGGTPAKFLIIDDGWQDTVNEFQKEGEPQIEGSQYGARLRTIGENSKFRRKNKDQLETPIDLKDFITDIKKNLGLKYGHGMISALGSIYSIRSLEFLVWYVYVWHALLGYWGGLVPNAEKTKKYNPKLIFPIQSPGNLANKRDITMDSMEKYGIGVIDPSKAFEFYDDLHKYLVSRDVDGVKVDVQNILETVSAGFKGRVLLTRQFQQALEKSITANFRDNSIICCMGHSTDSVYHSKISAITRASDDYYPKNPETQTLHIAAVSFNSIFFGEVVVPDWDMFYSQHVSAEFHAVARAIGGCGVYVSDKPGRHNFEILKRLVIPDGSVLRARYAGRPTRDCLFVDPVMDGKSLLKIWNLNKCTGVLGVFNCQGAGTWPCLEKKLSTKNEEVVVSELSGKVSPSDIEYFEEVSRDKWTGDSAVFTFSKGSLSRLSKEASIDVDLKVLECDVFTISPIKAYNEGVEFAPIGLTNMYNSGGAVEAINWSSKSNEIHIKGRGSGIFGAYSSKKPKSCSLNSNKEVLINYRSEDNLLTVTIPTTTTSWDITLSY